MIRGFDYSYAQGTIDWKTTLEQRPGFVYGRASYGAAAYDDDGSFFNDGHDACKSADVPFGAYHFFLAWQDGKLQANNFLIATNGRAGTARFMVDVEEGSFLHPSSMAAAEENLATFNEIIEREFGCKAIIYTNDDTWSRYMRNSDAFAGHDFWIAQYDGSDTMPDAIGGITSIIMRQYTSRGQVAGITENTVDLDVLYTDIARIAR